MPGRRIIRMSSLKHVCVVCLRPLTAGEKLSIRHPIASADRISVYHALQQVSDFKKLDVLEGPQHICPVCFRWLASVCKFRGICNKAVKHIVNCLRDEREDEEERASSEGEEEQEEEEEEEVEEPHTEMVYEPDEEMDISETVVSVPPESTLLKTLPEADGDPLLQPCDVAGVEDTNEMKVKVDPPQVEKEVKGKYRRCNICQNLYAEKYYMRHVRIHTGERPYPCTLCGKRLRTISALRHHQAVHNDHRPFICTVCGKGFKLKTQFQRHARIHTGERPFHCSICGKAFGDSGNLSTHIRGVHARERAHKCDVCQKAFADRAQVRRHAVTHTKVKKYACDACDMRFAQPHHLKVHRSRACKGASISI